MKVSTEIMKNFSESISELSVNKSSESNATEVAKEMTNFDLNEFHVVIVFPVMLLGVIANLLTIIVLLRPSMMSTRPMTGTLNLSRFYKFLVSFSSFNQACLNVFDKTPRVKTSCLNKSCKKS